MKPQTAQEQLARLKLERWQRNARRWKAVKAFLKRDRSTELGFLLTVLCVVACCTIVFTGLLGGWEYLWDREHKQPVDYYSVPQKNSYESSEGVFARWTFPATNGTYTLMWTNR